MCRKLSFLSFVIILVSFGCASTAQVTRTDPVKILLKNGDKIEAQIMDIYQNKVIFKTNDWKKAYEYGEVINIERIKGIQLRDGSQLSVKEYDSYRKGGDIQTKTKASNPKEVVVEDTGTEFENDSELQYDKLKKKPISEMTDHEFEFFVMMKKRELDAREKALAREKEAQLAGTLTSAANSKESENVVPEESESTQEVKSGLPEVSPKVQSEELGLKIPHNTRLPVTSTTPNPEQIEEVVNSLLEAELAPSYLNFLNKKNRRGEKLTATEVALLNMIENNPKWQEKLDDLKYINRTAQKALERAYLYNPDDLSAKLNLEFDRDLDMDYFDIIEQLHRKIGGDVKMADFRTLVDILGESGGRAVKEVLENYSTWQFVIKNNHTM